LDRLGGRKFKDTRAGLVHEIGIVPTEFLDIIILII
jgi:hypothetical protein